MIKLQFKAARDRNWLELPAIAATMIDPCMDLPDRPAAALSGRDGEPEADILLAHSVATWPTRG